METLPRITLERLLFLGLMALLLWIPLPLGSNREWSLSLLVGWASLLAAGWIFLWVFDRVSITRAFRHARPVLFFWGVLTVYVWVQATWSLPWMSSQTVAWYGALEGVGMGGHPVVSTEPYATLRSGTLTLALGMIFGMTLLMLKDVRRARIFVLTLIASGVIQAAYGIVDALAISPNDTIAHGTFPNRNHFAGYLEMILALGIGYLAGSRELRGGAAGFEAWYRGLIHFFLSEKAPLRIGVLIMALAVILSRSRMGNSAFMGSLSGVGLVCLLLSRGVFRQRLTILWVSILILDIGFLGSYFGLEKLAERIENTTVTEVGNRVDVHDLLQPYVSDFLPWGSGLGTFRKAFSAYYDEKVTVVYAAAEDEYLQFLGELGVGAFLLPPMVLLSFWVGLAAVRKRDSLFFRGLAFSALMGIVSILIHSFVDFNLQIPANAATFVVMLALCFIARYLPETETVGIVRSQKYPSGPAGKNQRL